VGAQVVLSGRRRRDYSWGGGNLSSIGDFIDLGGSEETDEEGKISLQTKGSPNPRTMRIQIRINNKLFMALVDAGSTYNLMHLRVARRLGLDTEGCCLNL
jgi:hypothetical protein